MAFKKIEEENNRQIFSSFCKKISPQHTNQVWFDYKIEKQDVVIVEKRPFWDQNDSLRKDIITELDIAKLKFIRTENSWILYWKRANGKWCQYEMEKDTGKLEDLLKEISKDPYGCFFG